MCEKRIEQHAILMSWINLARHFLPMIMRSFAIIEHRVARKAFIFFLAHHFGESSSASNRAYRAIDKWYTFVWWLYVRFVFSNRKLASLNTARGLPVPNVHNCRFYFIHIINIHTHIQTKTFMSNGLQYSKRNTWWRHRSIEVRHIFSTWRKHMKTSNQRSFAR